MPNLTTERRTCSSTRHTTSYLACGPEDGPLIIFLHGWPELSLSWRHQLPFFGAMGFRAIAPDMRGYGESTCYADHAAYAQREVVTDMIELLEHLGGAKAVWVGHDWGAPTAWNVASHHPDRTHGVACLCVPYATLERGLDFTISLVDRGIYPEAEFPAGQWEYMRFYEEHFAEATAPMDANPAAMVRAIFRKGSADVVGRPAGTAMVRKLGGWFGGHSEAPSVPRDEDVISEEEARNYADALARNGFFGPNSWYMNHEANAAYFAELPHAQLDLPACFIAARYDSTCEAVTSRMPEPMRALCSDLTETVINSGHWMAQEKPWDVNRDLARWVFARLPRLVDQR